MKEDPILIISDTLFDIQKGKGNRDGLIQQIVTYVRDGHTVTRKQWVRSEFADHAKKNEEEKKKTLLEQKERENKKHELYVQHSNEKQATKDERAYKKVKKRQDEDEHVRHGRAHKFTKDQVQKYKKVIDDKKKDKDDDKDKKKKHGAYGQEEQTKKDNKEEQKMIQPQAQRKDKKTKGVQ